MVGSLEVGKDGDFAVWSGNPLATSSLCLETWIDGKQYFEREAARRRGEARNAERLTLIDKAKKLATDADGDPAAAKAQEKFFFRALEDRAGHPLRRLLPGPRDAMEKLTSIFCALVALAFTAHAETLLLRGATVHTVAKGTLAPGDVLVRDGKIAAVAARIDEAADRTVDLAGLHLFPGLISAGTDLGLVEIAGVRATVDDRETGEFTPEVESWIAVNPDSELIPVARANGITHFVPVPQGKLLAGTSGLVAARGWTIEDMIVRRRTAMHLFWPDHSLTIPGPNAPEKTKPLDEQARERREKVRNIEQFFADAEAWEKRPAGSPAGAGVGSDAARAAAARSR